MITVICGIIIKDKKILITQRSEKMKLPLKWEFPGGKLEDNEDEIACIKRELKEELNIDIKILKKLSNNLHEYETFTINLIPYIVEYVSGEITLAEHCNYKLLDKHDLSNLDWAEADLPILKDFLTTNI